MSLDDFFSGGTVPSQKASDPKSDMVVIDLSNLVFRAIFGSNDFKSADEVNVDMIRHMVFNIFGRYRKIFKKDEYPDFVLAFDGGNLWRNQTFPLYKMNRKIVDPDETPKERDLRAAVGSAFGKIKEELLVSSPFPTIHVPGAEADDIMGVLAQVRSADGLKTVTVSGDKDMRQLMRLPGVKCWSPNVGPIGGFVKMDSPDDFLYELIFKGDGGDGVPGIKSPDNTFYPVKLARQPSIFSSEMSEWKKKIDLNDLPGAPCSAFNDPLLLEKHPDILKNYYRNRTMVDLGWIPEIIKKRIIDAFEQDKSDLTRRKMKFYLYLSQNNLRHHLNNIQHFV